MDIVSKDVEKIYKIKKGLFKTYDIKVVEDFNYCIKQGEIVGILGLEGSGKSTIIKLLSGNMKPTQGVIYIEGEENLGKLKDYCQIISDFDNKRLLVNESVYNNFIHFGNKYKKDIFSVEKNISLYKEVFELDTIINKKIIELNNLDLIKVNIVVSMLKEVRALFFDSALTNLSIIEKNVVLKLLKRLNKEYKTTIVVSGNNFNDVNKICKRISIIEKGNIIRDGSSEKIGKELFSSKEITIVFNKTFVAPKGAFEVLECSDYVLRLKIDFEKYDFARLISNFDINNIVDINISNVSLRGL